MRQTEKNMHAKAFIHKMLQDTAHRDGGYDIKTIVFSTLPWEDFEECQVTLADGTKLIALFNDGEKISKFVEAPRGDK